MIFYSDLLIIIKKVFLQGVGGVGGVTKIDIMLLESVEQCFELSIINLILCISMKFRANTNKISNEVPPSYLKAV